MEKDNHIGATNNKGIMSVKKNGKEEISMELAELGNLKPLRQPMTPNQREESQEEKSYD